MLSKMMGTTRWIFPRCELTGSLRQDWRLRDALLRLWDFACAVVENVAGRTGARRNANETSSDVQRHAVSLT